LDSAPAAQGVTEDVNVYLSDRTDRQAGNFTNLGRFRPPTAHSVSADGRTSTSPKLTRWSPDVQRDHHLRTASHPLRRRPLKVCRYPEAPRVHRSRGPAR
jgi:hypothetical protein